MSQYTEAKSGKKGIQFLLVQPYWSIFVLELIIAKEETNPLHELCIITLSLAMVH